MVNVWDITGPVLVLGSGVSVARLAAAAGVRMDGWADGEGGDRARGGLTPASHGNHGPSSAGRTMCIVHDIDIQNTKTKKTFSK